MIRTNPKNNFTIIQPLPTPPKKPPNIACKQSRPPEIINIDDYDDTSGSNQPLKVQKSPKRKKKDTVELIELDSDPRDVIFLDENGDETATASDSQGSGHSKENCFDFVSSDKRPPQLVIAKSLIKKKFISRNDPSLRPQKQAVELPEEDEFTKIVSKTNKARYLKPFWGPCKELTKIVALDCEMVRVEGNTQALARLTIVNYDGHVLIDTNVKPEKRIVDYLTWVSGIKPQHLKNSHPFEYYKEKVFDMLKDSIIVGHSLKIDCAAIGFKPDPDNLRDLALYSALRENNIPKSLKTLANKYLNVIIQRGSHDSVEDARASMALYRKLEMQWEKDIEAAAFRKKYFS